MAISSSVTRTWARQVVTTYNYNGLGDLTSILYSDGTPSVTFSSFDRLGRATSVTQQGIGAETISYHPGKGTQNARYYSQSHSLLPGIGIRNLSPNGAGQELGFEETSAENSVVGRSVSYGYDASGRLGSVTDGGETFLYSYHPGSSLIETIQSRVGVTTKFRESRAYNPMGRLTSISSSRMEGSTVVAPISSYSYQYDSIGRRVKSTLQDNSFWDYGYNDRSEVVSATRKTATAITVPALSATYSFDGIGNRLSSNSPMLGNFTYSPDSRNRYASIVTGNTRTVAGRAPLNWNIQINGAATDSRIGEFYFKSLSVANQVSPVWQEVVTRRDTGFPRFDQHLWFPTQTVNPTYDDDGNLTGDGRWVYFWDGENRLSYMETSPTALSAGHPVWQVQFVYDWQGRRIARHVWRGAGGPQSWTVKSDRWLYDGWNVVAEFSAPDPASVNLTRSKTYTWGLDLSGTLQGAGGVGGLLSVTSHSALLTCHYPSYDGNGNIIAWTQNDANAPTARREYDAFGNTLISEGSAPCDFGFSTKMREDVTGLYYYGYRFYDPVAGRWPSRDPIEEKGGVNLYEFIENLPSTKVDVLGAFSVMLPPPGRDPTASIIYRLSQLTQGDYLLPLLLEHLMDGAGSPYYLTYGDFSYATRDEDGDPIWNAMDFSEAGAASSEVSKTGGCKHFSSKENFFNSVTNNSLGKFNLLIKGKVCCATGQDGIKHSEFTGTIEIRDESFDFDLSKKRGLAGEAKTLFGWLFLRGGGKEFEIHQSEQIDFKQTDGRKPSY